MPELPRPRITPDTQPEVLPGGQVGREFPTARRAKYTETKPFGIPSQHLTDPIAPDILRAFGIAPDADQSQLNLALVVIEGASYDGSIWTAFANARPTRRASEDTTYGSVEITSASGRISPEEALETAEQWIRESPTTEWVPGSAVSLPIPDDQKPYFLGALLLVRARDISA